MLTEKERKEIEKEAAGANTPQAACLEALEIIQKSRGWVDDEALVEAATLLDMTAEELDGVASFYSLIFRKPVGRHVVMACDSIACWTMGSETVAGHLKTRLGIDFGDTTGDGVFTLLPVPCLGACDRAPALTIDGVVFGNLTPDRLDEILARHGWKAAP